MDYTKQVAQSNTSALKFTSSTVSAASYVSKDDAAGYSSFFVSLKNILQAVYRCDSAAVIDGTSSCTVANQALYQGVEVVLQKATCNYGDSLKSSVASKPFFEYKCFCDDDDFITHEDSMTCGPWASTTTTTTPPKKNRHVRGASTSTVGSRESRNERMSLLEVDDSRDNDQQQQPQHRFAGVSTPTNRNTRLTKPTRTFYSKINTPPSRSITRLNDVNTIRVTKPILDKDKPPVRPLDPGVAAEEMEILSP